MRILWDFDGTIFDTYPSIVENIYQQVNPERKHAISKEDIFRLAKVNAEFALKMLDFNEEQKQKVDTGQYGVEPVKNPPFPFVEEVLKQAELNVIMTHKDRKSVMQILDYYGMTHYFTEIVTKENGFPRKPHPAAYEYLHQKYQIELVVGDRQLDLIPGRELGILTCSFQNYYPKADYYLDNYTDFSSILLGKAFHQQSHVNEKPHLDAKWLIEKYGNEKALLAEVIGLSERIESREIAYLMDIGRLTEYKRSGFPPIDAALYALRHGFSAEVIQVILFNGKALEALREAQDGIQTLYKQMEVYVAPSVWKRIEEANRVIQ